MNFLYPHWSDNLYIYTTVHGSRFTVQWCCHHRDVLHLMHFGSDPIMHYGIHTCWILLSFISLQQSSMPKFKKSLARISLWLVMKFMYKHITDSRGSIPEAWAYLNIYPLPAWGEFVHFWEAGITSTTLWLLLAVTEITACCDVCSYV